MKLHKKLLQYLGSIVLLLICALVSGLGYMYFHDIYLPWQVLNYPHTFPTTSDDVHNYLKYQLSSEKFTVHFSEEEGDSVNFDVVDYGIVKVNIAQQSFVDWLLGKPIHAEYEWDADEKRLSTFLSKYYVPNENAELTLDADCNITLMPDVSWHEFDSTAVARYLEVLLARGENEAYLYKDDVKYTYPAELTYDDLFDTFHVSEWLNNFSIKYSDGTVLDKHYLSDYYNDDFDIDYDLLDLNEFLDGLEDSYDTVGKSYSFKTHDGSEVDVINVTLGKHVWRDKETEYIIDQLSSRSSSTDRVPEFYGVQEIGDTYIEVSIKDQHLWHFVKGELCCESDVVTGRVNGRDTPTGVYYISEMLPGKTLRGPGYATPVKRWMRLTNSGVGLHDAGWRRSFGGNIYKTSGSHGCINLPSSFAFKLYDEVSNKTPVVIY